MHPMLQRLPPTGHLPASQGGSWRPSLPGVWMWPDTAHQLAGRALPVRGLMTPQPAGRQREGSSQPRIKDLARQGSSHSSLQIHCLGCPRGGDLAARAEIRGRRQKEKLGFYGGGATQDRVQGAPQNEWINPWAMLPQATLYGPWATRAVAWRVWGRPR